jgi:hypothetical protein
LAELPTANPTAKKQIKRKRASDANVEDIDAIDELAGMPTANPTAKKQMKRKRDRTQENKSLALSNFLQVFMAQAKEDRRREETREENRMRREEAQRQQQTQLLLAGLTAAVTVLSSERPNGAEMMETFKESLSMIAPFTLNPPTQHSHQRNRSFGSSEGNYVASRLNCNNASNYDDENDDEDNYEEDDEEVIQQFGDDGGGKPRAK